MRRGHVQNMRKNIKPKDSDKCTKGIEDKHYIKSREDQGSEAAARRAMLVEVLVQRFYIIDKKKDPETPLLVGRGFLATANAVIDCRKAKMAVGEGITRSIFEVKGIELGAKTPYYTRKKFMDCYLPGEWEIARDAETNPFKDVVLFRRMVEFLRAIHINLKRNMWESED
ncbi:hypothetical protein Tco_1005073 [Tanacetum coccineum]|uniref:Uncharacterized protein n=1 Tax=Tanacetum coccineum TaxID=301880 RepID=A0ABQ5FDV9_9ASTR